MVGLIISIVILLGCLKKEPMIIVLRCTEYCAAGGTWSFGGEVPPGEGTCTTLQDITTERNLIMYMHLHGRNTKVMSFVPRLSQ